MSEKSDHNGPGRRWAQGAKVAVSWLKSPDAAEPSVHDRVYCLLRQMILYNAIEPGAWLRQKDISAQLQVSRTPVREAFRSLSQEGLVELVPNYGARVTQLSIEEFEEIYALRIGIEGLAARLTAQKVEPEQLPDLHRRLEALEKLILGDLFNYLQQEWQFRVHCYQVTQRQRLLKQILLLREHSERYIYLAYGAETRIAESFDFHCRLMEAFVAKNGGKAEAILQEALRWTLKNAGPIVASMLAEE